MNTGIFIIQIITFGIVLMSIVGTLGIIRKFELSWLYAILPLFFLLNLGMFLFERILVKTGRVTPIPDFILEGGFINAWAVGIQFHAAITAAVAIVVLLANGRLRRLTGHGQ